MYRQRSVAVVIPIHNEEAFIGDTIRSIPSFVDAIIVVDDGSRDATLQAIARAEHPKVHLIKHCKNCGVGAATISGYRTAIELGFDLVAVMDGDGQMDPRDLSALLDAIVLGGFDYAKGDRFLHTSIKTMPRLRYAGNRILSALMRFGLGLRAPLDAQCGYSAITYRALRALDLEALYPRYGFLNTLLFNLAAMNMKFGSVPVRTIYGQEISGINPFVTVPTVLYIILRGYLRRITGVRNQESEIRDQESGVRDQFRISNF